MLELLRHLTLKAFFSNAIASGHFLKPSKKFNANALLGFRIHFFAAQTTLVLARTISLPMCKNHTIYHTTFILTFHNAENILLSENIIIICVLFTRVPPTPIQRYRQLADKS